MSLPPNTNGYISPTVSHEFHGVGSWVFEMNDAKKNAHAQQMLANAEKTREEATSLRMKNSFAQLKLRIKGFVIFFCIGLIVGVGIMILLS